MTLVEKALTRTSFGFILARLKGVLVAIVVRFDSVFGRQPRGLIGLMACTPN